MDYPNVVLAQSALPSPNVFIDEVEANFLPHALGFVGVVISLTLVFLLMKVWTK